MRLRGRARVLDEGEEREHALELLARSTSSTSEPPDRPVLAVDVDEVRSWAADIL